VVGETDKARQVCRVDHVLSVSSADRVVGETSSRTEQPHRASAFQYPRRIEWWVRPIAVVIERLHVIIFQYPRRIEWWVRPR